MDFSLRTKLITGYGCLERIGEIVSAYGVKRVMLCTDSFLINTDAASVIQKQMKEADISCELYIQKRSEPTDIMCDEGADICREKQVELLIALGGGSVMDQAKAMAAIVSNGISSREMDGVPIRKRMLPVICIPTTAGTGSEVTFVSVITNTESQYKMTIMDADNLSPNVAICDPALLTTLPQKLVSSCGIDALTHAIEAYTSVLSNPFSDALALQAIKMISANIRAAFTDPSDIEAQSNMMLASTMAGAAFINADVGAVHAIAETVGVKYHIPHGVANSIFLPYVMAFNRIGYEQRYAEIGRQLGAGSDEAGYDENSKSAVRFVDSLIKELQIPAFSDFEQVKEEDFEELAKKAEVNPMSLDNIKKISAADYLNILVDAFTKRPLKI